MIKQSVLTKINRAAQAISLGVFLLFLAACQENFRPDLGYVQEKLDFFGSPTLPCPDARILDAGKQYVRYHKGPGRDVTDIEMEAQIIELTFTCGMENREPEVVTTKSAAWDVVVELGISIRARSGPAIQGGATQSIPFFVALVDRFGQIVEKQSFSAEITFPERAGASSRRLEENIVLNIPVRRLAEANSYETIVSFQLTQEQLEQTHHK